jgi:hypothetical protein
MSIIRKHASGHRRHSVRRAMSRDSGVLMLKEDNLPESGARRRTGEGNRSEMYSGGPVGAAPAG